MFWIFSLQLPERTYCVQTIRLRIPPPPFGFGLRTCGTAFLPGRTDSLELRNRHRLAAFSRCPHPVRNGDRSDGSGRLFVHVQEPERFHTRRKHCSVLKTQKYEKAVCGKTINILQFRKRCEGKGILRGGKDMWRSVPVRSKKRWLRIELRSHAVACKTVNYLYIMIYN